MLGDSDSGKAWALEFKILVSSPCGHILKVCVGQSLNMLLYVLSAYREPGNPLHMWCFLHAVYHVVITVRTLWGSLGLEILIIFPKSHWCKHCRNNSNWGRLDYKVCPLEYCSTLEPQVPSHLKKGPQLYLPKFLSQMR